MLNGPVQNQILASASRTVNPATVALNNRQGARAWAVYVNVSVNAGGLGSITVTLNAITASGVIIPLLASTALTAVAAVVLTVGLDLAAAANSIAKVGVPARPYVSVVHNNANPITYSVDSELLP